MSKTKQKLSLDSLKEYLELPNFANTAKLSVSPEQAKYILKYCKNINRSMNKHHISNLIKDMESGNWFEDSDYISFDSMGSLTNGQHRIKALSMANVDSIVLKFDFDVKQHISMDTGRVRSHMDTIKALRNTEIEIMPIKWKSIIMSGIKLLNPKVSLTNSELRSIYIKYLNEIEKFEELKILELGTKANHVIVKSSMFWAYLSGVEIDILINMSEVLRTGINKDPKDIPIIRLRDELIDIKGSNKDLNVKRASYTQQCIYNYLEGYTSNRLPSNPQMHYQNFNIL